MDAKVILSLVLMMPLSFCATVNFGGLPCTVGPIIGDKGASTRWTRSEKEQIVTLNRTGEFLCRWKSPA